MVEETIAWFGGVDWGSEKHQACLLDTQGAIVGEREFPHGGKGLSELADWILSMTGISSTVAIAVEVPHGPVVDVLLDRGFIVHAINPKQLDRLIKAIARRRARGMTSWATGRAVGRPTAKI